MKGIIHSSSAQENWPIVEWRVTSLGLGRMEVWLQMYPVPPGYTEALPAVLQKSPDIKQHFSEGPCVHRSSGSIVRDADSQAHVRPFQSETLAVDPLVCPLTRLCWFCWELTVENHCAWSVLGGDFAVLGDDPSLPVPSRPQPPLPLCAIQVFMDTHSWCQLVLKFKLKWRHSHLLQCQRKLSWVDFAEKQYVHLQQHRLESFSRVILTVVNFHLIVITLNPDRSHLTSAHLSSSLFWLLIKKGSVLVA